jgi:dolichyl-phosphate beta-glucosyltransferase
MHLHRWSFDVELLLVASLLLIPTAEVAIHWHEVDGSKISVAWDGIGMARDLLVLRGNLALGRWKLPNKVIVGNRKAVK